MAMVANNLALTDELHHGSYYGHHSGLYHSGLYGSHATSPHRFLARSLVTKKFVWSFHNLHDFIFIYFGKIIS